MGAGSAFLLLTERRPSFVSGGQIESKGAAADRRKRTNKTKKTKPSGPSSTVTSFTRHLVDKTFPPPARDPIESHQTGPSSVNNHLIRVWLCVRSDCLVLDSVRIGAGGAAARRTGRRAGRRRRRSEPAAAAAAAATAAAATAAAAAAKTAVLSNGFGHRIALQRHRLLDATAALPLAAQRPAARVGRVARWHQVGSSPFLSFLFLVKSFSVLQYYRKER